MWLYKAIRYGKGVKSMMERLFELGIKETVILTGDSFIMQKPYLSKRALLGLNLTFRPNRKLHQLRNWGNDIIIS